MKRRLVFVFLLLIIVLTFVPNFVRANSFKFGVKADKELLKNSDEVYLTFDISDIKVGNMGINVIEAVIEYDEDIFEKITDDSFTGLNNWSWTYNDGPNGEKGKTIAMVISAGETENKEIGKLKLKVKDNVNKSLKTTDIIIKKIATNDGVSLVNETDKKITLQLELKNDNKILIFVALGVCVAIVIVIPIILKKKK